MNVTSTALIILSLCGSGKARSLTPTEDHGVGLESEWTLKENELRGERVNEVLEEVAVSTETEDSPEGACSNVIEGAYFDQYTGTKLQTLKTNSIFDCCSACQEQEKCINWIRHRINGSCELYEIREARFRRDPEIPIDSGGFIDTQGLPVLTLFSRSLLQVDVGDLLMTGESWELDSAQAVVPTTQESLGSDCTGTNGTTYPNGDVIGAGNAASVEVCCDVCRSSNDCNSWHFNVDTNNCVLNRNVPEIVLQSSSRFAGGTSED